MRESRLVHFGALIVASMVFSGCVANQPAAAPQQEPQKVVVTPDEEVVIPPSGEPAKPAPKPKAKPAPKPVAAPAPSQAQPTVADLAKAAPTTDSLLEHYQVKLSSNKVSVAVGDTLSLHVIVDAPQYPISGSVAHAVQVSFSGLDFAAEAPAVECFRAHPSGSEIIYIVTATQAGTFDVAANVSVFPTRECSTFSVQKSSKPLIINVQ